MTNIRIIIVGGTIDKIYDPIKGKVVFPKKRKGADRLLDSHLKPLLEEAWCTQPNLTYEVVDLIDSLNMKDSHREAVFAACHRSVEKKIIVTHGTDTMVQRIGKPSVIGKPFTAKLLEGLTDKTIVLAGAMRPWSLGKSDAMFNVGMAVAAVQLLAPGVYVTMSGGIFPSTNVQKDVTKGEFAPKHAPIRLTARAKLK